MSDRIAIIVLVAIIVIAIALPVVDYLTAAPIMRRHVNSGTSRWRIRERVRKNDRRAFPDAHFDEDMGDDRVKLPSGRRHAAQDPRE
ncbi:MAG: hypothetical protein IT353_24785 [Gemmatimonadaceae bacterium]|nr:hypothetical protein [Gemmatimonadaceae bacterium]